MTGSHKIAAQTSSMPISGCVYNCARPEATRVQMCGTPVRSALLIITLRAQQMLLSARLDGVYSTPEKIREVGLSATDHSRRRVKAEWRVLNISRANAGRLLCSCAAPRIPLFMAPWSQRHPCHPASPTASSLPRSIEGNVRKKKKKKTH